MHSFIGIVFANFFVGYRRKLDFSLNDDKWFQWKKVASSSSKCNFTGNLHKTACDEVLSLKIVAQKESLESRAWNEIIGKASKSQKHVADRVNRKRMWFDHVFLRTTKGEKYSWESIIKLNVDWTERYIFSRSKRLVNVKSKISLKKKSQFSPCQSLHWT